MMFVINIVGTKLLEWNIKREQLTLTLITSKSCFDMEVQENNLGGKQDKILESSRVVVGF